MNDELPQKVNFLTSKQLKILEKQSLKSLKLSKSDASRVRVAYALIYNKEFFVIAMLGIVSALAAIGILSRSLMPRQQRTA